MKYWICSYIAHHSCSTWSHGNYWISCDRPAFPFAQMKSAIATELELKEGTRVTIQTVYEIDESDYNALNKLVEKKG